MANNYIVLRGDVLHQYGVNRHADNDEKCLEPQSQQAPQVVLSHSAPFLAHHGCHWNGCHRGHKVYLDHTAINDDKDADIQRPHGNADKERLDPQADQRSQIHFISRGSYPPELRKCQWTHRNR